MSGFVMLGDTDAAACVGDSCELPQASADSGHSDGVLPS